MSTEQREAVYERIEQLRSQFDEQKFYEKNEAATRLEIIDEVLLALGWEKADFKPETYSKRSGGYLDYLLQVEGVPQLVVEAKRAGQTFRSPNAKLGKSKLAYQVSYLKMTFSAALTEVIEQAEAYGHAEGVPFGVVTNGAEWLALQLVPTPGLSTQELSGIYFGNILTKDFRFNEFFELLSKAAVASGDLHRSLADLNRNTAEFSVIPATQLGDLVWNRPSSDAHRYLEEFYHQFFGEIVDEGRRKMLERCFVSSAQLDQYEADLKRVLKDEAPDYVEGATELSPGDRNKLLPGATGDKQGTVILIAGSVGAGKSTFVTKVRIESRHDQNTKYLVLNLIDESTFADANIGERLYKQVSREWQESYSDATQHKTLKQVFRGELEGLRTGPKAELFQADEKARLEAEAELLQKKLDDDELFIERSWQFHRQKGLNIVLVLDNVDRNSEEFQQKVYAFAHHVAGRSGATVIVTMRETTFFRGQRQGFLDVRTSDRIFHLKAPDLVQVVSTRLRYITDDLDGDHRLSDWRRAEDWNTRQEFIQQFATTLKNSLLTAPGAHQSRNLLAAAAWHNVRQFFSLLGRTHMVLGTDTENWTFAEVVAALGVRMNTENGVAVLSNLFRPPANRSRSHFLRARVLAIFLRGVREQERRRGVSYWRLHHMLTSIGYGERDVRVGIEAMVRERLLECVNVPAEIDYTAEYSLNVDHSFRASPLGVVIIKEVQFESPYLSLISYDLPIQSEKHFSKIIDALREVHELVEDAPVDRYGLALLSETNIHELVAGYLMDALEHERLLGQHYTSEIEAAERFFEDSVVHRLSRKCPAANQNGPKPPKDPSVETQQSLFEQSRRQDKISLPVPDDINALQIKRSKYAPKILWALATLLKNGVKHAYGIEITRLINQHLVEHKVSTTNVSRALRQPTLQKQPWLETISGSRPTYGLTSQWRNTWRDVFGDEPPF